MSPVHAHSRVSALVGPGVSASAILDTEKIPNMRINDNTFTQTGDVEK